MAGQLRVDEITDEAGTGSPSFPFGLPVGYAAGGTAPAAGSFTEVPSTVLEVGDPIRSSDIIAIKDNTLFLFDASIGFPILDQQRFDASGTWTKPNINTPEAATLIALLVGGGGAGGRCNTVVDNSSMAGGGGTGAVALVVMPFDLSESATITIGAGASGASATSGQFGNGNNGGASSIIMASHTLTANGGQGGNGTLGSIGLSLPVGGDGGLPGTLSSTGAWITPLTNFGKNGRNAGTASTAGTRAAEGTTVQPVFSGGGAAGVRSGTVQTQNNPGGPAFALSILDNEPFMGAGGTGSNTTAGSGVASGAGGGGAAAANVGTVTSGNGENGLLLMFVVRGILSSSNFTDKYLQIP